jgi:hypothetical protein
MSDVHACAGGGADSASVRARLGLISIVPAILMVAAAAVDAARRLQVATACGRLRCLASRRLVGDVCQRLRALLDQRAGEAASTADVSTVARECLAHKTGRSSNSCGPACPTPGGTAGARGLGRLRLNDRGDVLIWRQIGRGRRPGRVLEMGCGRNGYLGDLITSYGSDAAGAAFADRDPSAVICVRPSIPSGSRERVASGSSLVRLWRHGRSTKRTTS